MEIKFHLGQMAGHAVEIGNLLIEAKEQVQHGEWQNWLESNFNLKKSMAYNFMKIAERFSNFHLNGNFNQTQLVEMLALPEGEEENFIAEKSAENNPVEDMTVKQLREEIKSYKARLETAEQERDGYKTANELADAQLENLGGEVERLRAGRDDDGRRLGEMTEANLNLQADKAELQEKIDDLQNELLQKETTTVEVAPADYESTKTELSETKAEVERLQGELKNLQEKPIEVAVEKPADYDSIKSELADLKDKQKNLSQEYAITRIISSIFSDVPVLLNYTKLIEVVKNMADKDSKIGEKIIQLGLVQVELKNYFEIWEKEQAKNE